MPACSGSISHQEERGRGQLQRETQMSEMTSVELRRHACESANFRNFCEKSDNHIQTATWKHSQLLFVWIFFFLTHCWPGCAKTVPRTELKHVLKTFNLHQRASMLQRLATQTSFIGEIWASHMSRPLSRTAHLLHCQIIARVVLTADQHTWWQPSLQTCP